MGEVVHIGPFRVVESNDPLYAAVLDDEGNTILVATRGMAHRIVTACNAYPKLHSENKHLREAIDKVRHRLRNTDRTPATKDCLWFIDEALADDEPAMEICPI